MRILTLTFDFQAEAWWCVANLSVTLRPYRWSGQISWGCLQPHLNEEPPLLLPAPMIGANTTFSDHQESFHRRAAPCVTPVWLLARLLQTNPAAGLRRIIIPPYESIAEFDARRREKASICRKNLADAWLSLLCSFCFPHLINGRCRS